jgi:hypothetical protein
VRTLNSNSMHERTRPSFSNFPSKINQSLVVVWQCPSIVLNREMVGWECRGADSSRHRSRSKMKWLANESTTYEGKGHFRTKLNCFVL